ncbi:MAG: hypothetical protein H6717_37885 [Polyangiaceae bacterium]|nr:hypothetical protein [Polyangiaceae bacterium]
MKKKLYGVIALGACAVAATVIAVPKAQAIPPIKKPVTKTVNVPSLNTDRQLSPAETLALKQAQFQAANLPTPPGLWGTVQLSARNMYAANSADLTPHCPQSIDPVKNEIVPSLWQLNTTGQAPCAAAHKQGLTLRLNFTRPNEGAIVAVAIDAKTSGHFEWAAPAHRGQSPARTFGPGFHVYHSMFIPKSPGWFTAELHVRQGDAVIKGIQIN